MFASRRQFLQCFWIVALFAGCMSSGARSPVPGPEPAVAVPTVIADTEEDVWPDPHYRTYVRLMRLRYLVESHRDRTGEFPSTLAGLLRGTRDQTSLSVDAWGTMVRFHCDSTGYSLASAGPDMVFGTADDLVIDKDSHMPTFSPRPGRTRTILELFQMQLAIFHERTGNFPRDLEELRQVGFTLYLGSDDEWGVPVRYSRIPGSFEVRSAGPDGIFDTSDDLVVQGPPPFLPPP